MSVKLYNGLRIDMDIFELDAYFANMRSIVKEYTYADINKNALDYIIRHADLTLVRDWTSENRKVIPNDTIITNDMLFASYKEFRKDFKEDYVEVKRGLRNPNADYEAEFMIYPYNGKLYGYPLIDNGDLLKLVMAHPAFVEYAYYDNTDRPDGVSAKEWRERKKVWTGIYDAGNGTFGGSGFIAKLTAPNYDYIYTPIVDLFQLQHPTKKERVKKTAQDFVFRDRRAETTKPEEHTFAEVFRIVDYMKTEEGKAHVKEYVDQLMELMPDGYTYITEQ